MKLATRNRRIVTLNLTSLIDVLFILIIFFSVSSTFLEQQGIKLKLPEAESGEANPAQQVTIFVDREENIFLNDKSIELKALADIVGSLISSQTEKSVILSADSEVKHGTIISIMDLLRKEGIFKIIISTAKPSTETNVTNN